ncbi:nitrous oxide reductase family maturation protein NosD [Psychroflexus sp. CAK57W]|uniref:nitrous oxide reductase family maturation protein NosD n=1 Tax=Psychroflexus curvus TaxID=2873595 RepID=UPI001CCD2649|nr:nitrous oxide reductase family maturation protein NosD [Psychroflexus curvus]MBZ9627878.1 nitrous oxide reductase family maturation protein NosD [Psychroflexus curvus]MBZ9787555.1 nitrous oxide reductase family maturation protein NosD [Psychroflexus curvus]
MKSSFFLLCLIIALNFSYAQNRTLEVCAKDCEFTSIQQAVDQAKAGDSIFIKKGVYKEHDIFINRKSLHLYGEKGSIIDIDHKGYGIKVEANDFSITDLTIKNVEVSYTSDYAAIYLFKCDNFKLKNITLKKAFFGFLIEKSSKGIIEENDISGIGQSEASSGNAIHLWNSKELEVRDNDVYNMRDGIYIEFGSNNVFENNTSHDNMRYGLHFMFSDDNRYSYNTFQNNSAGVAVMFSKRIQMNNNVFKKNWGTASYGLLLKEISDGEIYHNTFENNTTGITADGSTRINYYENDFINNGYAVKFIGGSYKNKFYKNNFLYNNFDLSYSGRLNNNSFDTNYWSDYTGYDLDNDNYGDVPYRPVKLFSYLVNETPESIILLRSLFVDIINFSEKVTPVFTPKNLTDQQPLMSEVQW